MSKTMISVLYVDDEPDLLEIAQLFLEQSGEFRVVTCTSAEEALDSPTLRSYDAIISDYQMPGMDGITFLKAVRERFGNIPFLLFTGRGREEVVIDAINNGADSYIQKGGDPTVQYAELAHKIRQAVRREKAEATLEEQEQRVHDLQNASDLIHSLAPNGHFLFVNKKWQDTLGYREEDLADLTLFDILHDENREHGRDIFLRVTAGENVGIIDVVFKTRDGKKVYAEGLSTCKMTDGKPQYTRGVFKDVTERKQMEAALAENRDYLDQIYSSVQGGIVVIDAKTHEIIDLNPAAERMMGTTRDQIVSRICHQFICPSEKGRCPITDLHQAVDNAERVMLTADGKKVDIIKYVIPVKIHGRECLLETILDNTERKKAADELHVAYEKVTTAEEELRQNYEVLSIKEQALRESEEKFRTIFENSPYPIAINSIPDSKFLEVNKAFLDISGYTVEEVIGKDPMEMGFLSLTEALRLISQRILMGKIENVPLAVTAKDGKRVHVLFSTMPITIKNKPAIVTVTAEVTKLKRVEEELIRKNEDLNAAYEEITATEEEIRANYDELSRQGQALRESEEKYRRLTEVTSDVIYTIDLQGKVTHISPQVSRYGYAPEEVISRQFTEFLAQDEIPTIMADLEKTLSTGKSTVTPIRIRDKTGGLHWMEDNGTPVCDASGSVVGITGILRDISERKKAEEVLRASEEKFRAVVELSLDGILITDLTGNLLFANSAAGRIVGVADVATVVGKKNVLEFVAPESRADVIGDFGKVAQGIDAYLVNYKILTEVKQEIWIECIGKKIPFGDAGALLISMRDVTERKKADDVVRASEKKFATVFKSSPVSLTLVSATDGTFVDVNDAFIRSTGYAREDVIGKTSEELGLFADRDEYGRMVTSLRDQGSVHGMELHCRLKSGEIRTCRFTSGVIMMDTKPAILSTLEDITEHKKAEEALRESEEKFRSIVETSPDMIWEIDMQGKFRYISPNVTTIIGYTPEEIIGRSITDLVTEQGTSFAQQELARHISSGGAFLPIEVHAHHRNGNEMVIEIRPARLTGPIGTLNGFRGVAIDITKRKKAEDAIRRANHQLSLLGSATRHDLLNKITVILGYLKITQKNCTDPGLANHLGKMESAITAMRSQVEFTRLYQDLGSQEPQWIELDKVMPRPHVPSTITLTTDVQGVMVFADAMLEKVFSNLLDNAIRHGEHVTEIRASFRKEDTGLVVVWEDNGAGIAAAEKDQIFERGFGKNTGLGLFLVREILALTGITIRETGVPGSGARFEIVVPEGTYRLTTVQ
jgi:PAS domain S-box-containing protein